MQKQIFNAWESKRQNFKSCLDPSTRGTLSKQDCRAIATFHKDINIQDSPVIDTLLEFHSMAHSPRLSASVKNKIRSEDE